MMERGHGIDEMAVMITACSWQTLIADMVTQQSKDRFLALDSWRGIAAVAIAIYHFQVFAISHLAKRWIDGNFWLFVDFFSS